MKKFRKGELAVSRDTVVLCTGAGGKQAIKKDGLDYFSGVVVLSIKDELNGGFNFSVGTYSDTWNDKAFIKTKLKINKIIEAAIAEENYLNKK